MSWPGGLRGRVPCVPKPEPTLSTALLVCSGRWPVAGVGGVLFFCYCLVTKDSLALCFFAVGCHASVLAPLGDFRHLYGGLGVAACSCPVECACLSDKLSLFVGGTGDSPFPARVFLGLVPTEAGGLDCMHVASTSPCVQASCLGFLLSRVLSPSTVHFFFIFFLVVE